MSFINYPVPTPIFPVLPPLTWSVHKKPILASRNTIGASGWKTGLACAVYPRWSFILSYGGNNSWLRDQTQNIVPDPRLSGLTELQQLSALFLQCRGAYGEFYYTDPDDSSRSQQLIGYGDGSTTTFTVFVGIGSGPFSPSYTYPVGGINSISAVYVGGTLQNPNSYSIDASNTKIVFTSAPGNGGAISVTFSFYFRCRFLDDVQVYSQWAQNLWNVKEVRFESVKP